MGYGKRERLAASQESGAGRPNFTRLFGQILDDPTGPGRTSQEVELILVQPSG